MKLQLKRSLKTLTDNITAQAPTVDQMEYGELAINYATTDATIFLKDSNNVIQKLQVSAVPDVPAGETLDDRYVSLSGSTLTGNLTAPSFIGGVARTSIGSPTTGQNGELWWNTSNGRLYIYDGDNSSWVDASPDSFTLGAGYYDKDESDARYVAKAGSTMTGPLLLSGNPGGEALAATPKQYVDGQVTGLDTTLRTYIDAQIATRAATTYVNTQLALKANTTYVTSAISTSEATAATAYVSKSGDVISGDLTANAFIGDGSQLTGVGSETIISNTPPTPANYEVGTMWWNSDSSDTSLYILYQDPIGPNGDPGGKYWIEASPAPDSIGFSGSHTGDSTFTGNMNVTGPAEFDSYVNTDEYFWSKNTGSVTAGCYLYNFTSSRTDAALKISNTSNEGGTTIDLNYDGSASFAGVFEIGDGAGPSDTGFKFNPAGWWYATRANGNTDVFFRGYRQDTGVETITLDADGSAKFTGDINGGPNNNFSVNGSGSTLGLEGYLKLFHSTTETHPWLQFFKSDGSGGTTKVVEFFDSGSATFAGGLTVGDYASNTAGAKIFDNSGNTGLYVNGTGAAARAFGVYNGSSSSYPVSIYHDGSATFTAPTSYGVKSQVSGGNNGQKFPFVGANSSGTTTFSVDGDGRATFANYVHCQSYSPNQIFIGSGSGGKQYAFYSTAGDGSTVNVGLGLDGSASFTGDLDVGNPSTGSSNSGVKVYSNGGLYIYTDNAEGTSKNFKFINTTDTEVIAFGNDGSAEFAETVQVGDYTNGGNAGLLLYANGSAVYNNDVVIGGTGASRNIQLKADGSAEFASKIQSGGDPNSGTARGTSINEFGTIRAAQNSGTSSVFEGYTVGTSSPTSLIKADGSAMFAGNITAGNVSDIKFKENIEAAPSQLSDISAFKLKTFDWKDEAPISDELKAQRKLGLIAQEVEAICPEMVYEVAGQDGDSYKAINHDVLIMKLLGAVKELTAEVAALKAS
jgi:hypothetical protein